MNGLTLCGGDKFCHDCNAGDQSDYCMKFSDGEWSLIPLLHPRSDHSSWQAENGIFLIGGYKEIESEFVPSNGEPNYPAFPVKYEALYSCSISDVGSHSVIITGGFFYDGEAHVIDTVTRYDEDGFVEYLPSLHFARAYHGCGSFIRDDGNQVFLVAGGAVLSDQRASTPTEVLTQGSDTWTLATPLPQARSGLAGVTVDNRLYMTGGMYNSTNPSDEILEWRDEEQIWALGLWMENGRSNHAASSVTIDDNIMKYCH